MSTALFTIGTNGYGDFFADHIASQRAYASKHCYDYVAFTRTPPGGISASNSAWLKVPLLWRMLQAGYQRVMFADIDAMILPKTPPLATIEGPGKSIFMAPESDGRFNAGVIICDNTRAARTFLKCLWTIADVPGALLPKKDRNLYENGHVNTVARWFRRDIQPLSAHWNFTTASYLPDGEEECYINHGRGVYGRKPRSRAVATSATRRYWERLRQGPRTMLLRRLSLWYMQECRGGLASEPMTSLVNSHL